ncbi:MAG: tetratricopeptide repeat protein [Chlorobiaceae bacterium]|nr:tetratricopeptide repeat protein [Chlorobiaceae bacterium]
MNPTQKEKTFDESTLADRWLEIVLLHKNKLVALVSIILIVVGGGLFWMQKVKTDEKAASLELMKVAPYVASASSASPAENDAVLGNLQTIIKRWGHTPSGNQARLYLATLYCNSGKTGEALALYEAFKSGNKDLQASAIGGSAACRVQQKKYAEAAAGYEKASQTAENEALKAMYLNNAAESYRLDGQPAEAVKRFEQVVKSWPESSSAAVAQRTLWRLEGQGVPVPQL